MRRAYNTYIRFWSRRRRTGARTPFVTAVQGPGCVDNFCMRLINNRTHTRETPKHVFRTRTVIITALLGKATKFGRDKWRRPCGRRHTFIICNDNKTENSQSHPPTHCGGNGHFKAQIHHRLASNKFFTPRPPQCHLARERVWKQQKFICINISLYNFKSLLLLLCVCDSDALLWHRRER